jgi:hypothetical protein
VADDLIAVPAGELRRFQDTLRRVTALTLALWALVIILAVTLARKRIVSLPDLARTVGWHG